MQKKYKFSPVLVFKSTFTIQTTQMTQKILQINLKKKKNRKSAVDDDDSFLGREHAFGQNQKLDRFIVINDVLDLASGVLKNSCIYIFHIIYLEKSICKLILLQVKIFSIFSGSVEQSSFLKILSANCVRETILYLLQNYLCINRHFVNLANKSETICLSRDCRGINANEPGRFRIQANNAEE